LNGHAEELMELAVDAAQSRHLPGFLERFAERAARMLSAEWCAVMVFRGRETDSYQTSTGKDRLNPAQHTTLIRGARELGKEIEVRPLPAESGRLAKRKKIKRPFSYRSPQAMRRTWARFAWYAEKGS